MNTNYNLELTASIVCGEFTKEIYFDPYNDCTSMGELKDFIIEDLQGDEDFEESEGNIESIEFEISNFDNVPEDYANENDVWEYAQAFAECSYNEDIVIAALNCGIDPSDIDEAYQGEYKDDADFAQEMAESLGAIDKNAAWPMNCIDWEYAAKELMYDYSSDNGYYFRSL